MSQIQPTTSILISAVNSSWRMAAALYSRRAIKPPLMTMQSSTPCVTGQCSRQERSRNCSVRRKAPNCNTRPCGTLREHFNSRRQLSRIEDIVLGRISRPGREPSKEGNTCERKGNCHYNTLKSYKMSISRVFSSFVHLSHGGKWNVVHPSRLGFSWTVTVIWYCLKASIPWRYIVSGLVL